MGTTNLMPNDSRYEVY